MNSDFELELNHLNGQKHTLKQRGTPHRVGNEFEVNGVMYTVLRSTPAQSSGWDGGDFYIPPRVEAVRREEHGKFLAQVYSIYD